MTKSKSALLTVDVADLRDQIKAAEGNVVVIQGPGSNPALANLLTNLEELTLFQVVAKKDPNLEQLNVKMDYYDINPIPVETINMQPGQPDIRINGEIVIPKGLKQKQNVLTTFYTNEEDAIAVTDALNDYTNQRVEEIITMMQKTLKFRQSIVDKD